jgi:Ca2+-binding EF-hand superfamily protein
VLLAAGKAKKSEMDACTLSLTINNQSSGNAISLTCPVGKINYQNDEFLSYKYLFETLDLDDDGRISFKEGNELLSRSKVPRVRRSLSVSLSLSLSLSFLLLIENLIACLGDSF